MGIFSKLKQAWFGDVNWEKLDDEFFDNLEESLILADVGVNIAAESVNSLRNAVFSYDMKDPEQVKAELRKILLQKLSVGETALDTAKSPTVILVIGVNGVGKTTSIGKLANRLKAEGKNPFTLDSKEPTGNFREFLLSEVRYSSLQRTFPEIAEELFEQTEATAKERLEGYKKLAQG